MIDLVLFQSQLKFPQRTCVSARALTTLEEQKQINKIYIFDLRNDSSFENGLSTKAEASLRDKCGCVYVTHAFDLI